MAVGNAVVDDAAVGDRPSGARRRRGGVTGRQGGVTRHNRVGYALFLPFLAVFVVTIVAPLVYAIYLSLYRDQMIGGNVFSGLANYTQALGDSLFLSGLSRVGLFLVVQVPVMLILAMLIALAIDSGRLAGAKIFRIGVFIPYAVPGVVATLMWGYLVGRQFGLAGSISADLGIGLPNFLSSGWMLATIGNVTTWEFTGYNMLIFYAALRAIPVELYEAAEVDGAGEFRKAWSIKVPALRRALVLATTFSIIGSFQLFNEPSIMQQLAPGVVSTNYTPNLYAYNLAFNGQEYNYAAAVAVVLGVVTVVLAYVVQLWTARRERVL